MAVIQAAINYLNFLIKKYILISAFIHLVKGLCPNNNNCECTSNYINCTCTGGDDLIYITQTETKFYGKEIIISKCGKVEIEKLSMNRLNLDTLQFVELNELIIESYSLSESFIKNIFMHNISILQLESYSLSDIKDCNNLEIVNASVENFPPAAIGNLKVKSVEIKDCHIGTIHSRAFSLSYIEKFTLENNYVNTFDITAVVIRNAKEFNFIRNAVTASSFGSFSIAEIDNVEVDHSSFRQIHGSMIITKEVKSFSFHDCYIETCESRAFWSIEVKENVAFSGNEIKNAEEDSLIPNFGPVSFDDNINIEINNNLLTCDCHLNWIWIQTSSRYAALKSGSLCNEPEELKGKSLSELTLLVDGAHNCIGITENNTIMYTTKSTTTARKKSTKLKNTKIPNTAKKQFTTESISTTKEMNEASFITDASAEKQGLWNNSVNLHFCKLLIILTLFLINYKMI